MLRESWLRSELFLSLVQSAPCAGCTTLSLQNIRREHQSLNSKSLIVSAVRDRNSHWIFRSCARKSTNNALFSIYRCQVWPLQILAGSDITRSSCVPPDSCACFVRLLLVSWCFCSRVDIRSTFYRVFLSCTHAVPKLYLFRSTIAIKSRTEPRQWAFFPERILSCLQLSRVITGFASAHTHRQEKR